MSDLIISSFDDSRRFKVKLQKMIKGGMLLYIYDPGRIYGVQRGPLLEERSPSAVVSKQALFLSI